MTSSVTEDCPACGRTVNRDVNSRCPACEHDFLAQTDGGRVVMTDGGQSSSDTVRLPRYSNPRVEEYTREGLEEDQECVKVVRGKTVRTGTLTGEGTSEIAMEETLADFPAGNAYLVMHALADHFNCEVNER